MTSLFEDIIEDIAISSMLGVECKPAHKEIYDLLEYLFGELYPDKINAIRYNQIYRICTYKFFPKKNKLYLNIRDMHTKNSAYNTLFRSDNGYELIRDYFLHKHEFEIFLDYMQVDIQMIWNIKDIYGK